MGKIPKYAKLLSEEVLTERQAKQKLMELYPNKDIKKVLPYHYAPSGGSRPVKVTVDRKGMLKHKKCKQRLYKKQAQQHILRDDVY